MDVEIWLRNPGPGQYEGAFEGNESDGEVWPNLTSQQPLPGPLELQL